MKYFWKGFNFVFAIVFYILALWGIFNAGMAVVIREALLPTAYGYYLEDVILEYPFNVLEKMFYAPDEWVALHEVGHLVDDQLDHPSQTEAFMLSVAQFHDECNEGAWYNFQYDTACDWIRADTSYNFIELYANIYREYRYGMRFPSYLTNYFRYDWKEIVYAIP